MRETYDLVMDYGLLLISVSGDPGLKSSKLVGEVFVKIANEWEKAQSHGNMEHREILQGLLDAAATATMEMFQAEIEKGLEDPPPKRGKKP